MTEEMPSPPFPSPSEDNVELKLVVEDTYRQFDSGEIDAHLAILHAAVHGWMEGHLEGHECGDDFCMELAAQHTQALIDLFYEHIAKN